MPTFCPHRVLPAKNLFRSGLLLLSLLIAAPAQAGKVVLPDVHGELDMRAQASALTFLIQSALVAGGADVVTRPQLAQVITSLLGESPKYALVVRGSQARRVMLALRADTMISGELQRDGSRLTAKFLIFRKGDEEEVDKVKRTAPHGQVAELAQKVALALGKKLHLKKKLVVPDTSLGDLHAFTRAGNAALTGDTKASIEALQAGDPAVALQVPGILEAGRALAEQEKTPMPVRLDAALFSGNYKLASRLAANALKKTPKDELALATMAFVHLQKGEIAEAKAMLAKAGRHKKKALSRLTSAAVAHQAGNTGARDAELKKLVKWRYLPALRLIAALDPGALAPWLEQQVLKVAQQNVSQLPGLAASLGLRAARGDVKTEAALDLIHVSLLNTREVKLLEPLVRQAVEASWQVGFRLQGELYLTRGNIAAADNAMVRAVHADAKEPKAQRLRGYILMEQGDKAAAARAFTEAANNSEGSAEGTRWELYRVLKMNGDKEGAERVKAQLAKKMDLKPMEDNTLNLEKEAQGWSNSRDQKITSENKESRLQDALRPVVNAFPVLGDRAGLRVAMAPVRESWWHPLWPTRVNTELTGEVLRQILSSPPYLLRITESGPVTPSDLTATRLDVISGNAGTEGLLIYQVSPHLLTVKLRLIYYRVVNGEALEYEATLDGDAASALGLVTYKGDFIKAIALAVGLFILIFLIRVVRGQGDLRVRIQKDPSARNAVYSIKISRSKRPIDVGDPQAYEHRVLASGGTVGRYKATLPSSSTEFTGVVTGRWYVHLYGTHRKENNIEVLNGDNLVQEVYLSRGASSSLTFDLEPRDAMLTVHVYDGGKTIRDAVVWLGDDKEVRVYTDRGGKVSLPLPRGEERKVHVQVGDRTVTRTVKYDDTSIHHLTVNMAKERKLDEVELSKESELDIDKLFDSVPKKKPMQKREPLAPLTAEEDGLQLVSLDDRQDKVDMAIDYSAVFNDAKKADGNAETVVADSAAAAKAPVTGKGGAPAGLDRYERLEELGRGGMGVVYKARDRVLEREVALKIIGTELKDHPEARKLFLSEAKAMAALNHPNLVIIFDQGWDGDSTFVVMEYVEGETMERLITDKGPPPIGQGLDYFDQLCCGLAFAHSRNIIHRDIKPENIFISNTGTVKIGDFGLAKVAHNMRIKRTEVRGTPMYMAPEQIRGKDIDHRADIYSLGCTAFAMFCGRPPFTEGEVLYHHIHSKPPKPSDIAPNLPPELDRILLSCLTKRKDDRVPSVEALRKSLRPLLARLG